MLGEKILQLRKAKGLSQEELASQLTISRQAISKWELGEAMPDTDIFSINSTEIRIGRL